MRFLASLGVLCIATTASAQTTDLTPFSNFAIDDGSYESSWKTNNPSTASDWFNVDYGGLVTGVTAGAIALSVNDTQGFGGSYAELSLRTSAAPGVPDISATGLIAASPSNPVNAGLPFGQLQGYAIPCVTLGSDVHVAVNWNAGDTNLWVAADSNSTAQNRSYFTGNNYTTSFGFAVDWSLQIGGFAAGSEGTLLVNGASSAAVMQKDRVCLTFTGCQSGITGALYLASPLFFGPLLPLSFTTTGGILGGPCDNQWSICSGTDCNTPSVGATGPLGFVSFYLDPCNLKANGKPSAQVSSTATLTINLNTTCVGCFGQKDDGILDAYIWKVNNPGGPSDWFNVNHGSPNAASGINNLTGVELSSWDFCGFGPSWAEVGIYPDNGANPGTPDIANPYGAVNGPTMAPGAGDWAYPATFYDTPDFGASPANTYHAAMKWQTGDTCVWVGSDTDGTDSSCGNPISTGPYCSDGSASDYSTGAAPFTTAHWMAKIDWN